MPDCTLMNMCMVYNAPDDLVLVQDRTGTKWPGITFPGGHVESGESVYQSVVREVKEETGLTISGLEQVGLIHMHNPAKHESRLIFLYKTSQYEGELIGETREGRVFWTAMRELEDLRLAPNMREYLRLFLGNDVIEMYVMPAGGGSKFTFYPGTP